MSGVVTFGEIMARISTPGHMRFIQGMPGNIHLGFAGAEANVAAGLASLGADAYFVSVLPDNPIGDACLGFLRSAGVDTTSVIRIADSRLGVYYIEHGASQRPSHVVYDRDYSALSMCPSEEYDWNGYFSDRDWLHVTGITPALSRRAAESTLAAVQGAKRLGLTVSCDLNFRGKLWKWDAGTSKRDLAREIMTEVLRYVDIVVANEADTQDVLGISAGRTDVETGKLDIERYPDVAAQIVQRFGNVSKVAITLRESISASHNRWGGMLYNAAEQSAHFAPLDSDGRYRPFDIHPIVDRLGAGDAFCAALVFALRDPDLHEDGPGTVAFAAAAGALCHTLSGDFNFVSREEVLALARGAASGRVTR